MSSKIKIIIAVLVIALLLGVGYLLFFNNNSDNTAVTTGPGEPSSAAEATFLDLTSQIDPISFDTSVLTDPRFTSLVDIHTAILPEPQGRKDPFSTN
jgi:hypothetical protein